MKDDNDTECPHFSEKARKASLLVRATWISGLLLPWFVGIVADLSLRAKGFTETSLGGGLTLLLVTPITAIPFLLLALIVKRGLGRMLTEDTERFDAWLLVCRGSLGGLAIATVFTLIQPIQAARGTGDPFFMMLALWPISIPLQIIVGGFGCIFGGVFGALLFVVRGMASPSKG